MPKSNKNTVIAWDESNTLPLLERITLSKEVRERYKNVGKPRKVVKPNNKRPVTYPLTVEERMELVREHEEYCSEKALLSRLCIEKAKLEDRIAARPPPLEDRIEPKKVEYTPPAPLPKNAEFHKTKDVLRHHDFKILVGATVTRLLPFLKKALNPEYSAKVPEETLERVESWTDRLQDISTKLYDMEENFTNEQWRGLSPTGRAFTNAQWRKLRGACKRIGKVDFTSLDSRFVEICNALAELEITLP